jgi:hypothetical protein
MDDHGNSAVSATIDEVAVRGRGTGHRDNLPPID